MPTPTDGALLAAFLIEKKNNKNRANPRPDAPISAFEQLLLRYEKLIYHVAYRYFANAEDAMDAAQEAVLRVYKGLDKVALREDGTLKNWICAVTAHVCLDELRKRRVTTEALPAEGDAAGADGYPAGRPAEPSAEDAAQANETVRELLAAIQKLPPHHRLLIILRDMQGLSYRELALATKVNEGTVKSRLSRARSALKKLVEG